MLKDEEASKGKYLRYILRPGVLVKSSEVAVFITSKSVIGMCQGK
jgi:hypothetical protein